MTITLSAHVSKGTYIRSLARDIALALGTVGHVTMLRRVRAGPFTLDQAISLDNLNEMGKGAPLESILLPLEAGLDDIPAFDLTSDQAERLRAGQKLDAIGMIGNPAINGLFLTRDPQGIPVALTEIRDGLVRVVRGFNLLP
jgi:tRNA pseudouridine55 synthase